jgi:hypothetical protein
MKLAPLGTPDGAVRCRFLSGAVVVRWPLLGHRASPWAGGGRALAVSVGIGVVGNVVVGVFPNAGHIAVGGGVLAG